MKQLLPSMEYQQPRIPAMAGAPEDTPPWEDLAIGDIIGLLRVLDLWLQVN